MSSLSDKLSGKSKQMAGDATGDNKMKAEGKLEEARGGIKDKLREVGDKISDKAEDIKHDIQK